MMTLNVGTHVLLDIDITLTYLVVLCLLGQGHHRRLAGTLGMSFQPHTGWFSVLAAHFTAMPSLWAGRFQRRQGLRLQHHYDHCQLRPKLRCNQTKPRPFHR
eukprot:s1325_g8.t5